MTEQASRKFPDMWVDPEDDPRETDSTPRGEKAVLAEYLDRFRMTFEMKCEGLDAEQLAQRSVPPSSMSLLGLVRHLASVELHWFRRFIEGQMDLPRLYKSPRGPRPRLQRRRRRRRRGRRGLGVPGTARSPTPARCTRGTTTSARCRPGGDAVELREIVVHMIEEYARHCGHADLLRERIDGRTGQ